MFVSIFGILNFNRVFFNFSINFCFFFNRKLNVWKKQNQTKIRMVVTQLLYQKPQRRRVQLSKALKLNMFFLNFSINFCFYSQQEITEWNNILLSKTKPVRVVLYRIDIDQKKHLYTNPVRNECPK